MTLNTDKAYWHRYVDVYERAFARLPRVTRILEFGVLRGDSIRWLADRFPDATLIVGCDILPPQPSWPVSPRICYEQLNQASIGQLRGLFRRHSEPFDLVIEDGSHEPRHQRNCLVETLPHVSEHGMYILEDLQTSHPGHQVYQALGQPALVGPLHLLLVLEQRRTNGAPLDAATRAQLASNSLFTEDDVQRVWERLEAVEIYRRATLPLRCFQCGQSDRFDVGALRCACGADLYAGVDSMSAIIQVRTPPA